MYADRAMDADRIEESLLMELRGRLHEATFTGASAVDTFMAIKNGVRMMVSEDRTSDDDLQIARDSLHRFLDQMEQERDRLGVSEFHEVTVSGALFSLCPPPCWPFC
jgi:hypothetical protein